MERIRRFQRTLIIGLTGINTFVFPFSNEMGTGKSLLLAVASMLIVTSIIYGYLLLKKQRRPRRSYSK